MFLKRLSLINFKNIEQATIDFEQGINAFVGDNGGGKTNILDSIYYLSMCKSMLSQSDRQSIRHDSNFFVVDGEYSFKSGKHENVVCTFSTQRSSVKTIKRNGKEYERLSDHVGLIPVVVVSPQDTSLILSADDRRKFLNGMISQLNPAYLTAVIKYNTLVIQRNRLLKNGGEESMLSIYDEQMRPYAEVIHTTRSEIISQMSPLVEQFYHLLSGERETVNLSYTSAMSQMDFIDLMLSSRQRDLVNQYTTCGVHRDDLSLNIGEYPLRKYGSQGQQKSFLIALKLAQYMLVSKIRGERAILLLDDLFDKLDSSRVEQLMQIVCGEEFGQIFITDCNRTRLNMILSRTDSQYTLFEVEGGQPTLQHKP